MCSLHSIIHSFEWRLDVFISFIHSLHSIIHSFEWRVVVFTSFTSFNNPFIWMKSWIHFIHVTIMHSFEWRICVYSHWVTGDIWRHFQMAAVRKDNEGERTHLLSIASISESSDHMLFQHSLHLQFFFWNWKQQKKSASFSSLQITHLFQSLHILSTFTYLQNFNLKICGQQTRDEMCFQFISITKFFWTIEIFCGQTRYEMSADFECVESVRYKGCTRIRI